MCIDGYFLMSLEVDEEGEGLNDYFSADRKNWKQNAKFYLFCKCCGLILAPLMVEGYSIEGDAGYCHGCSTFFYERFGFKYRGLGWNQ